MFYSISTDLNGIIGVRNSMDSPETVISNYSKGRLLGKGGFAECYEFINLETKKVEAAKIIQKSSFSNITVKEKVDFRVSLS
jgi:hypothetical protein